MKTIRLLQTNLGSQVIEAAKCIQLMHYPDHKQLLKIQWQPFWRFSHNVSIYKSPDFWYFVIQGTQFGVTSDYYDDCLNVQNKGSFYRMNNTLNYYCSWMNAQKIPEEKVVVVGHSLGGWCAQKLCAIYPRIRGISLNPGGPPKGMNVQQTNNVKIYHVLGDPASIGYSSVTSVDQTALQYDPHVIQNFTGVFAGNKQSVGMDIYLWAQSNMKQSVQFLLKTKEQADLEIANSK